MTVGMELGIGYLRASKGPLVIKPFRRDRGRILGFVEIRNVN